MRSRQRGVDPVPEARISSHLRNDCGLSLLDANGYLQAHEAAQHALDLLAYLGAGNALITDDGCVQWWRDDDGFTIRPVVTREVGVQMSVSSFSFPAVDASGADNFAVLLVFILTNRQLPKTRYER